MIQTQFNRFSHNELKSGFKFGLRKLINSWYYHDIKWFVDHTWCIIVSQDIKVFFHSQISRKTKSQNQIFKINLVGKNQFRNFQFRKASCLSHKNIQNYFTSFYSMLRTNSLLLILNPSIDFGPRLHLFIQFSYNIV